MWTNLKNFPDGRNSQCLLDSLTYLAILCVFVSVFKYLIFLAITRRNSSMSMPPLLCAKGILKQIHKHFSFEFQCSVWRGHFETQSHTQTHKCTQTYQFWLCNTPLTCQCPSQVQAAAPKIWDDGWQLYIIILSTNQSGRRLETRYHHRGNLLTDCFHLFSFWVLAQRPQQITQLLLDHCVSMSQFERAG